MAIVRNVFHQIYWYCKLLGFDFRTEKEHVSRVRYRDGRLEDLLFDWKEFKYSRVLVTFCQCKSNVIDNLF